MAPRTRSRALLVTDTPAGGIEKLPEVMYPGKDVGTPSTRRQQFSHVGLAPSQIRQRRGIKQGWGYLMSVPKSKERITSNVVQGERSNHQYEAGFVLC